MDLQPQAEKEDLRGESSVNYRGTPVSNTQSRTN